MGTRRSAVGSYSLTLVAVAALAIAGCGGGGGSTPSATMAGLVKTSLSDPPSCQASYQHVYVTIADVKASTNADAAGSDDSSFVDLTPQLAQSGPVQVDLLGTPNADCLLASLGSTTGLQAGTYEQIRVILVANNANVTLANGEMNACPSGYNCAEDSSGNFHMLSLPSEAQTGIKIPPGDIESEDSNGGSGSSGGLTIAPGQGLDLAIDFNACASIVKAGNSGRYNLKPTLRAFEVGLSPLIAGDVVVGTTDMSGNVSVSSPSTAVPNALVYLEQQSRSVPVPGGGSDTLENYIESTMTDSSGHFQFCPVEPSSYEIVTDAPSLPGGGDSNATVTTGVNVTSTGGPNNLVIPLVAETGGPATIDAAFTTANSSSVAGDDITVNALQQFTDPVNGSVQALIPFFTFNGAAQTTPAVTTTDSSAPGCSTTTPISSCPSGTNCACATYTAPVSNPVVGAASTDGSGYTVDVSTPTGSGAVDAAASQIGSSGAVMECMPPEMATAPFTLLASPAATDGGELDFTGCD